MFLVQNQPFAMSLEGILGLTATGSSLSCQSHRKTRKKRTSTGETDVMGQGTKNSFGFRVPLFLLKLLLIRLNVIITLVELDCSWTLISSNVAVAEGQPVISRCSAQRKLAWIAYAPGSLARDYVSTSALTLPSNQLLHESADKTDLSYNTTKASAKRYLYIEEESGKTLTEYEAIVLDVVPICVVTIDTQHINASCSIKFAGNWAPTMQWEWWIGENKSDFGSSQMDFVRGQTVSSAVSTQASAISNYTVPWKWQCVVKFTESGRPHATGANVPEYNYTWSTQWITYASLAFWITYPSRKIPLLEEKRASYKQCWTRRPCRKPPETDACAARF